MKRFEGKTAVVTGAARGIGAACAEILARDGSAVIVTDVLTEAGLATADDLRKHGRPVCFKQHDVADRGQWSAVMDSVLSEFGRIDIVVNNAGINIPKTIEEASLEEFEAVIRVNLIGCFLGLQQAIRAMKSSGGGAIVNIASNSTRNVLPLTALYGPTKAAVANLTKVAALHCAAEGYNIRVNSVHPGMIDTEMITGGAARAIDIPQVRDLLNAVPLKRIGTPREVAEVVAFLASDAASYITAEEYFVDGGITASLAK